MDVSYPEAVEQIVCCKICNERLYHVIAALPEIQRGRLVMYYFYDLTYEQIAEQAKCSVHFVFVVIKRAEKNKKFFNNF